MTSLGQWTPNVSLAERLQASASGDHRSRYLYAEEQKLVCDQLALNEPHIVALALRGTPSKAIAAIYGVSREAIDKRLRRLGMKNPPGVHGRPRKVNSQPLSQEQLDREHGVIENVDDLRGWHLVEAELHKPGFYRIITSRYTWGGAKLRHGFASQKIITTARELGYLSAPNGFTLPSSL